MEELVEKLTEEQFNEIKAMIDAYYAKEAKRNKLVTIVGVVCLLAVSVLAVFFSILIAKGVLQ